MTVHVAKWYFELSQDKVLAAKSLASCATHTPTRAKRINHCTRTWHSYHDQAHSDGDYGC